MVLTKLTKDETKVVLECLKAIVSGFFISNDIFTTLLGHTRSDIERLIAIWDISKTARRLLRISSKYRPILTV